MNCFIDVETSGLDPDKHAILQLAAIIPDGDIRHTFNKFVKPLPNDLVEEDAIKVHGLDPSQPQFENPWKVYRQFKDFLGQFIDPYNKKQKLNFIAYNSPFDSGFVRSFFKKNGDKFYGSWFWHPDLCVMRAAGIFLSHERANLENFKLQTVAEYLNIDIRGNKLHDALYDIELTMKIWGMVR